MAPLLKRLFLNGNVRGANDLTSEITTQRSGPLSRLGDMRIYSPFFNPNFA
jgi:hypothetical protein